MKFFTQVGILDTVKQTSKGAKQIRGKVHMGQFPEDGENGRFVSLLFVEK